MYCFVLFCLLLSKLFETLLPFASLVIKTTKKETINAKIYNLELKYTIRRKKQALGWRKNLLEALLEKDEKKLLTIYLTKERNIFNFYFHKLNKTVFYNSKRKNNKSLLRKKVINFFKNVGLWVFPHPWKNDWCYKKCLVRKKAYKDSYICDDNSPIIQIKWELLLTTFLSPFMIKYILY